MSRPLHIVAVHGSYQWAGGEDSVFRDEQSLLREHGHTVTGWEKSNSVLEDYNSLRALSKTIWNRSSYIEFKTLLRKTKPDIVHCHNTFGIISPSIYYAASSLNIPVVQTLHNYRYCCLNAILFRDGTVCEDCVGRAVPLAGIINRCYRGRMLPSLGMFALQTLHRAVGTWKRQIDAYIVLTHSAGERFATAGLPADKLFVKPNFTFDTGERDKTEGDYVFFSGRLSEEKGVKLLVEAWEKLDNIPLKIAGKGPQEELVKNRDNIELLGWLGSDKLVEVMKGAKFIIVPSVCYEQFPMAVIEAFCCGVPVLASNHGAMADLVKAGVTGETFEADNAADLIAAAGRMWLNDESCVRMGKNARQEYEKRFSPDENYRQLMDIYDVVTNRSDRIIDGACS